MRDCESSASAKESDVNAISYIRKGVMPMREILTNRLDKLEILQNLCNGGDILVSMYNIYNNLNRI